MRYLTNRPLRTTLTAALVAAVAALGACSSPDQQGTAEPVNPAFNRGGTPANGAVFTSTNAVSGNAILAFSRSTDGTLSAAGSYATGGEGTGGGLGSQGAVTLSADGQLLLAVNAGSAELSAFAVNGTSLTLLNTVASGGSTPISVTADHGLVYVLNAGGAGNISGFRVDRHTGLTPIVGSTRPLSSDAPAPAQVSFSTDGNTLVVTEKGTNRVVSYAVDRDGLAGEPQVIASSGQTPFGFAFGLRNILVVSEAFGGAAGASAASSYRADGRGTAALDLVSGSVLNSESASCWTAITPDGKYAYIANTGSSTVSAYAVSAQGALTLLDADGVSAQTGAGTSPADEAISQNGQFLYVRSGGANTVSAFRIASNGSLTPIATVAGFPQGYQGLAAR